MRQFLRVFGLASVALLGIFYIATLTEFATYLFRGTATTGMVLQHFYFETPRYVTFLIPLSALISTLVVFGLLTKNSELIVMRACGVSLYRSAVPVVLLAVALSAAMYGLQEQLVPDSHRKAEAAQTRDAGDAGADLRHAGAQVDRRPRRRHLSLREFRSADRPVQSPDGVRPGPQDLAARVAHLRQGRRTGRSAWRRRRAGAGMAGTGGLDANAFRPAGGAAS